MDPHYILCCCNNSMRTPSKFFVLEETSVRKKSEYTMVDFQQMPLRAVFGDWCVSCSSVQPWSWIHQGSFKKNWRNRKSTGVRIVGQNYFQCKCAEANVVSARSLACCVPGFSFRLIIWQHGIDFLSLGQLANLTRLKMNLFDSICKIRADLIK